jgi:two-component system response regulator AtoC
MLIRDAVLSSSTPQTHTFEVAIFSHACDFRDVLCSWTRDAGCQPVNVESPEAAALWRHGAQPPAVAVIDISVIDGFAVLSRLRELNPGIPIIAVSDADSIVAVVRAMRLGASDVVTARNRGDFRQALGTALNQAHLTRDMATMQAEVDSQSRHTMLFGTGHAMASVRELIDCVIDTDAPVLIEGETGTGKELVARLLTASPLRRGKPFVVINCAALPAELLEAELFGFERGAFTGAMESKRGKFEIADGGTIFLDEIGEIPVHLQSKLLQVLQDGHFQRLGGRNEMHAVVRVIAATNRNLDRAVREGQFREDLLFRLNVIPVRLPPLRERQGDIPMLSEFFSKRWSVQYRRRYSPVSAAMMDELLQYRWPGNIRELENLIQRTVVLGCEMSARETLVMAAGVPAAGVAAPGAAVPVHATVRVAPVVAVAPVIEADRYSLKKASRLAARRAEAALIAEMLQQTRGNRKQAAMKLRISYKALLYKAKEHGLGVRL